MAISFVIPCLNEEKTLPLVLDDIGSAQLPYPHEVVVADNGSTDGSIAIAEARGARVVRCPERGYGAALQAGIHNAENTIIVFADADSTYDFGEAPKLIQRLVESDADMVIGSRLDGSIQKDAMPFLHRYLGTPVLTWLINRLHAGPHNHVRDCNSGFRCFKKFSFLSWNVRSPGMEFASEMLIKALRHQAKLEFVPITLRSNPKDRIPHLRTWRDGMRHLLQVLVEAPRFFQLVGSSIFSLAAVILTLSFLLGPRQIAFMQVFDIHTVIMGLFISVVGHTFWSVGLFVSAKDDTTNNPYRRWITMPEDQVFWMAVTTILFSSAVIGSVAWQWMSNGFSNLNASTVFLLGTTLSIHGFMFISHIIAAHLIRRVRSH